MTQKIQLVDDKAEIQIEVEVSEHLVKRLESVARRSGCTVEELVEHALANVEAG